MKQAETSTTKAGETKPPEEVHLVSVTSLGTEAQVEIHDLAEVREWTRVDRPEGMNPHLAWLYQLKQGRSELALALSSEAGRPIGVTSLHAIDRHHRRARWAFFLQESSRPGLAVAVEHAFLELAFESLGLEKLSCEVSEGDVAAVARHESFGFHEEGFLRSSLVIGGERKGSHLLGLTREDWLAGRDAAREVHAGPLASFSISIELRPEEVGASDDPIDRIEEARTRNNLNWMSILRLALEKAPRTARPIVAEIRRIDHEIYNLIGELPIDGE